MNTIFVLLPFLIPFWLIRNIKYILFWVYLWQLKQYHRGRFLNHFKTQRGRRLLYNPIQIAKTGLAVVLIIAGLFFYKNYLFLLPLVLFLVYFAESILYFKALFAKKTRNPVLTKKTATLVSISCLTAILYPFVLLLFVKNIFWFSLAVLIFDVLLPLIVSIIVICLQPLADYYRLSLQEKAREKISNLSGKNLTIIAITGSYGKTSTKEYLKTILSSKFRVLATKEHQNTEVAIPQIILNELNEKYDIFIVEMGAYDKGTIKRICEFLRPEIGIVTGVNEQHLALFGSMENLLSAEGGEELLRALPIDGLLVVNGENNFCLELYNKADIRKIAYKLNGKIIKNLDIKKNFASFSIGDTQFRVDVLGEHNVLNLLGAIQIAEELGMSVKEISRACEKISAKNSAFKITRNSLGFNIIDSTYSANPDGAIADLKYLKLYSGKKIIIMPCLIELGGAAKRVHQKIGKKIAEICDLAIITTSEFFEDIKNSAVRNGMKKENIEFIADANLIVGKIKSFCKPNDTILLEGRISENIISKIKN